MVAFNQGLGRKWVRQLQNDKDHLNCLMEYWLRFSNTPVPFKNHFPLLPFCFCPALRWKWNNWKWDAGCLDFSQREDGWSFLGILLANERFLRTTLATCFSENSANTKTGSLDQLLRRQEDNGEGNHVWSLRALCECTGHVLVKLALYCSRGESHYSLLLPL